MKYLFVTAMTTISFHRARSPVSFCISNAAYFEGGTSRRSTIFHKMEQSSGKGRHKPKKFLLRRMTSQPLLSVTSVNYMTANHRKLHMTMGTIHMMSGIACFSTEMVGICLESKHEVLGTGVFSGVSIFVAGLLGFLAGQIHNRCCVLGCMVTTVIATFTAFLAIPFSSIELSNLQEHDPRRMFKNRVFMKAKCISVLGMCIFEFVLLIAHASYTCANTCSCCMTRKVFESPSLPTRPPPEPDELEAQPQPQEMAWCPSPFQPQNQSASQLGVIDQGKNLNYPVSPVFLMGRTLKPIPENPSL